MVRYCSQCGASVEGARFCGQCGERVESSSTSQPRSSGVETESYSGVLSETQLGALAYATPIPAISFLLFEPFNRSRFLRFHSYQCLFLTLAAISLAAISGFVSVFQLLGGLLAITFEFVLIALWILAACKAWQGDQYGLPIIGGYADRHARTRR